MSQQLGAKGLEFFIAGLVKALFKYVHVWVIFTYKHSEDLLESLL